MQSACNWPLCGGIYKTCADLHFKDYISVTSDTEGNDGRDWLRQRWDCHTGGVDQRRPHYHPFTGPAGHGHGTFKLLSLFLCILKHTA